MDGSMESSSNNWAHKVSPRVAVVGVGGAGCNVINDIYWSTDIEVDTIAINMDRKALSDTGAHKHVSICKKITRGEGARGDPDLGRSCGKAHSEDIASSLEGYDIAFIIAGMGGGTGTGVTPVVAEIAQRSGVITFVIAINPFSFEGPRVRVAREGIRRIQNTGCICTVVDNDRLLKQMPDVRLDDAFHLTNDGIIRFIKEKTERVMQNFLTQLASIDDMMGLDEAEIPTEPLPYMVQIN